MTSHCHDNDCTCIVESNTFIMTVSFRRGWQRVDSGVIDMILSCDFEQSSSFVGQTFVHMGSVGLDLTQTLST